MTLLFELEVNLEISAFRPGGEERCVLLGGHIKVLIHLSTLSEFQFPHLFIRSITDAGDLGRIGPEVSAFELESNSSSTQLRGADSETGGNVRVLAEPSVETGRPGNHHRLTSW